MGFSPSSTTPKDWVFPGYPHFSILRGSPRLQWWLPDPAPHTHHHHICAIERQRRTISPPSPATPMTSWLISSLRKKSLILNCNRSRVRSLLCLLLLGSALSSSSHPHCCLFPSTPPTRALGQRQLMSPAMLLPAPASAHPELSALSLNITCLEKSF